MSEQTAYIGIGSNLNDPVAQVRAACNALALIPETRLLAASSLYSNPPMGPQDQPDYVNAVAALHTRLSPRDLLSALLAAELAAGRDRNKFEHWGPRVLDLDLLVHGSNVLMSLTSKYRIRVSLSAVSYCCLCWRSHRI